MNMKKNLLRITVILVGTTIGASAVYALPTPVGVAQDCEEKLGSQGTIPDVKACKACCRENLPAGSTETEIHLCGVSCAGNPNS